MENNDNWGWKKPKDAIDIPDGEMLFGLYPAMYALGLTWIVSNGDGTFRSCTVPEFPVQPLWVLQVPAIPSDINESRYEPCES